MKGANDMTAKEMKAYIEGEHSMSLHLNKDIMRYLRFTYAEED